MALSKCHSGRFPDSDSKLKLSRDDRFDRGWRGSECRDPGLCPDLWVGAARCESGRAQPDVRDAAIVIDAAVEAEDPREAADRWAEEATDFVLDPIGDDGIRDPVEEFAIFQLVALLRVDGFREGEGHVSLEDGHVMAATFAFATGLFHGAATSQSARGRGGRLGGR
jgi:hypothetical protein